MAKPTAAQQHRAMSRTMAKAQELLGDGEWHDWEETIFALMPTVPPNIAYHVAERDRAAWHRRTKRSGTIPPRKRNVGEKGMDRVIATGQRSMARSVLTKNRRFERDGNKVRMIPFRVFTPEERSASARKGVETVRRRGGPSKDHLARAIVSGVAQKRAEQASKSRKPRPDAGVISWQVRQSRYTAEERAFQYTSGVMTKRLKQRWREFNE